MLKLAVGPGEEIVAAYGDFSAKTGYKAWRIDNATGQTLWEITPPMPDDEQGWLADVIVTPDEVVLLVEQHNRPEAHVDVSAWGLTDGAPLWRHGRRRRRRAGLADGRAGADPRRRRAAPGRSRDQLFAIRYEPGPVSASLVRLSSSGQVLGERTAGPPRPDVRNSGVQGHYRPARRARAVPRTRGGPLAVLVRALNRRARASGGQHAPCDMLERACRGNAWRAGCQSAARPARTMP